MWIFKKSPETVGVSPIESRADDTAHTEAEIPDKFQPSENNDENEEVSDCENEGIYKMYPQLMQDGEESYVCHCDSSRRFCTPSIRVALGIYALACSALLFTVSASAIWCYINDIEFVDSRSGKFLFQLSASILNLPMPTLKSVCEFFKKYDPNYFITESITLLPPFLMEQWQSITSPEKKWFRCPEVIFAANIVLALSVVYLISSAECYSHPGALFTMIPPKFKRWIIILWSSSKDITLYAFALLNDVVVIMPEFIVDLLFPAEVSTEKDFVGVIKRGVGSRKLHRMAPSGTEKIRNETNYIHPRMEEIKRYIHDHEGMGVYIKDKASNEITSGNTSSASASVSFREPRRNLECEDDETDSEWCVVGSSE